LILLAVIVSNSDFWLYIYSQKNKKARLFFFDVVLRGTPAKLSEYWTLVRPRRHPRSPRRFLVPSNTHWTEFCAEREILCN
jgi:hypothetical protein